MCDYSLMGVPNRLGVEDEELVLHRFRTGTMGLASPADLIVAESPAQWSLRSTLRSIKAFFDPPEAKVCAVCIPPGATLVLEEIPGSVQMAFGVGPIERVKFFQLTTNVSGTHRDAVRFDNGREVRLQDLSEGTRVVVMSLEGSEERSPVPELQETTRVSRTG
jgi:hypothetical protein